MERTRVKTILWPALGLALLAAALPLATADARVAGLLRNSMWLALGACAIALPLGTALALLLLRTDAAGRRLALTVLVTMLFVPLFLQAAGWDAGLGRQGWFSLSRGTLASPMLDGWRAAVWIHAMAAVAWVLLIVGLGLRYVEPELEEAALLEASARQVFWRVTLRRALPSVVVAALWIAVTTAGEMTVTDLYQVRTFAEEIYANIPTYQALAESGLQPWPGLTALALLLLAALLAAAFVAPPDALPSARHHSRFPLGGWRRPAGAAAGAAILLVVGLPLANLCVNAGMTVQVAGGQSVRYWSAAKFWQILADSPGRFAEEFGWSFLIAGVAAAAAVSVAAPLAWLARRSALWSYLALATTAAGLAVPGPLIGLSLIWLLNRESSPTLIWLYDRTILAPVLALLVRTLPIAILISWHGMRSLPDDVLDAASTEGAGAFTRFWRIAVPQRATTFCVTWLIALALGVGDLAASVLVIPPGVSPVSLRVFSLLHSGVDDQLAGLCLTLVGACVLLAGAALLLVRRQQTRVQPGGREGV